MAYTPARVTLYALIIAIEEDLRDLIKTQILPQISIAEIVSEEDLAKLKKRYFDDIGAESSEDGELVHYLDIGQLDQIINSSKVSLSSTISKYFKNITKQLQVIYKIRNRVMHGRPLEIDDLPKVAEFSNRRLKEKEFVWKNLSSTVEKIKDDPNFLFTINIPEMHQSDRIANNLPLPDYDETGFIGRAEVVESVKNALNADWPVITIIGDGGQGKTALALRIAYEILDDSSGNFDAIIWTTAKSNRMGIKEIIAIEGAITDSLGIFKDISQNLIGDSASNIMDEIIEYLSQFKILLILDNLETILDEKIKEFLRRLPRGSKVLITTRISVGAYEYPVKIGAMNDGEAIQLIRTLVSARNIGRLFKIDNKELVPFINKMHNNPGYIKWFVTAIQSGMRPEDALTSSDFLEFCMSNVYIYLDEDAKYTLQALQSLAGSMSYAEISHVTEFEPIKLQKSLNDLQRTNMITTVSDAKITDSETQYALSEFARAYLKSRHPVKDAAAKLFLARKRKLTAEYEERKNTRVNLFSPKTIQASNKSEIVAGRLLKRALEAEERGEYDAALDLVGQAKSLIPYFFEVYRVEGWIKSRQGDTIEANESYERAIEYNPSYAPLRYFYGNFLMYHADDIEEAVKVFMIAESLTPDDPEIKFQIARCYLYLKDFPNAARYIDAVEQAKPKGLYTMKKLYDIRLQYLVRRADYEARNFQRTEALSTIEELKAYYSSIPDNLIDSKMKDTLKKVRHNLDWLYRCDTPSVSNWANELITWIRSV